MMTHSASVKGDSFESYIAEIRSIWGNGNDPQLPFKFKSLMEKLLASTSPDDPSMAKLIRRRQTG